MAPRGRGRGGGRGRGRGGSRHRNTRSNPAPSDVDVMDTFDTTAGDFREVFAKSTDFTVHVKAQEADKFKYLAAFVFLRKAGMEVLQVNRVRALAAAWARQDEELAQLLLGQASDFGVVEVVKALGVLDSARAVRAVEKRAAVLKEAMKTAGVKGKSRLGRRLVQLKKDAHNLSKDKPPKGTASGALARHIRRWCRGLTAEKLEFYALHLPRTTWTELADKVHLHPEKDFPALPWFLRYCYDATKAPPDTLVARCADMDETNVNDKLAEMEIPYAHVKQFSGALNDASKEKISRYTPELDTVLWYYEDLACAGTDSAICGRLDAGEAVRLPYGKLMERLLTFHKLRGPGGVKSEAAPFLPRLLASAEQTLRDLRTRGLSLESPTVVIGDASASMSVAIETSTIIASFLRALTNAELVFFSSDIVQPLFLPKTVAEVLELALATKTIASTCHASALLPYYEKKEVVKTFIVTTDEEENTSARAADGSSYRFLELFKKYHAEVYPARLVFVSFLNSQHAAGQMVPGLREAGFDVTQFKLDGSRPDLTKLDNLVGQLSLATVDAKADAELSRIEAELRADGLGAVFKQL